VKLTPLDGAFYDRISLGDGNAIVAVLAKSAIKITREGANPISIESSGPLIG
jgi:hypothetical protein